MTGAALAAAGAGLLPAKAAGTQVERGRSPTPWGHLERLREGVWAMVSTPLVDHPHARRTLCNGGIIAGRDGLVVIEGFGTVEGAEWIAAEALRLTGLRPTHVVLTHYHGDHTTGTAGYLLDGERPKVISTATTRRLVAEQEARHPPERREARPVLLPDVVLPDSGEGTELDLGGTTVRLVPRRGHTASDLVLEVEDIAFVGDLVWNGMFPNYMDAIPSQLAAHVRALREMAAGVYVSGHGAPAHGPDMDRYIALLDHVEEAARRAIAAGEPLEAAAARYAVPEELGEWLRFSPRYPAVAFAAWARELEA